MRTAHRVLEPRWRQSSLCPQRLSHYWARSSLLHGAAPLRQLAGLFREPLRREGPRARLPSRLENTSEPASNPLGESAG